MSARKFLCEGLGLIGLFSTLYGWTLVGHAFGF
jgi:hypothetical protein